MPHIQIFYCSGIVLCQLQEKSKATFQRTNFICFRTRAMKEKSETQLSFLGFYFSSFFPSNVFFFERLHPIYLQNCLGLEHKSCYRLSTFLGILSVIMIVNSCVETFTSLSASPSSSPIIPLSGCGNAMHTFIFVQRGGSLHIASNTIEIQILIFLGLIAPVQNAINCHYPQ